ncbi:uncharacterized protein LOC141614150 [Silene latifolia]|uniref:uncharacterized protein LOC141614150 n=1 Tax=Silene latifolia TaxID=37657 RepID=UPI003D7858B2
MKLALELGVRHLHMYNDSLLIVNHVNDEFIVRDSMMIAYLKVAKELKQKFETCKLKQIPRYQNVEADALATLGAMFKPTELSSIPIAHMIEPSIQKTDEIDKGELEDQQDKLGVQTATEAGEGSQTANQPPDQPAIQAGDWDWGKPYLDSLRHNKLPDDKKEVRAFRVKASRFILIDDTLFRKSLAGGRSLSNKALRQGYFWPTMRADAAEYARLVSHQRSYVIMAHSSSPTMLKGTVPDGTSP